MGKKIDHGLGGKDNSKSRERRARKAERNKQIALKSLKVTKKNKDVITEVVYDDSARTQWLTSFRQRKTERRKYGLAMQVLKEKKAHKEALKQKRAALIEAQGGHVLKNGGNDTPKDSDEETESGNSELDEQDSQPSIENAVFSDAATVGMFGGEVSVEVGSGVEEADDSITPDLREYMQKRALQEQKKQLTKFERAVQKVQKSGILSQKKKKFKKRAADEESSDPRKVGKNSRPGSGSKAAAKYSKYAKVKGLLVKAGASRKR